MSTFFTIFFAIVGVVIFMTSIFMMVRTKKLNKSGVKVTATVINIEKVEKNLNGKIVDMGYDTTFKILYDGEYYTEKKRTSNFYEEGSSQNGIYMKSGKKWKFYLDKEGVYTGSTQNAFLMLYLSGIPFLLALVSAAPINQEILFGILFLYITALAIGIRLSPIGFSRFKYENPESAQGVKIKDFFRIRNKPENRDEQNEEESDDKN